MIILFNPVDEKRFFRIHGKMMWIRQRKYYNSISFALYYRFRYAFFNTKKT